MLPGPGRRASLFYSRDGIRTKSRQSSHAPACTIQPLGNIHDSKVNPIRAEHENPDPIVFAALMLMNASP